MEGISLRPAFAGLPLGRPAPLFWEHEGNCAVRDGQWKLVLKHPGGWELYDVVADRTEQHDLAAQHAEIVERLRTQWEAWAKRVGVRPSEDVARAERETTGKAAKKKKKKAD
jgi:arylsulfatase